ncbi:hypothetical protein IAI10_09295 [Clostridium sp. 19966]|uniref:CD3324 family protein n=1 Tax=Clostridium sp. 19966 TaxID=2768166 RepID=UPI0028DE5F7F|nr:CD3324 family protein [Clostridium sp. 19966]MDT8716853.1 hypothetical protein [Clostridium sp. 19966]
MAYIKAEEILPKELLESIQRYVDGECLYIPRRNDARKSWGEKSGTRISIDKRNREIFNKYKNGLTIIQLANMYFLSEKTIQKIIYKRRIIVK